MKRRIVNKRVNRWRKNPEMLEEGKRYVVSSNISVVRMGELVIVSEVIKRSESEESKRIGSMLRDLRDSDREWRGS